MIRGNPMHDVVSPPGQVQYEVKQSPPGQVKYGFRQVVTLNDYVEQVAAAEKPKLSFEQWYVAVCNPQYEDITFARMVWEASRENL
jgi:hypothetical protein